MLKNEGKLEKLINGAEYNIPTYITVEKIEKNLKTKK